jgi:hypothetical protein
VLKIVGIIVGIGNEIIPTKNPCNFEGVGKHQSWFIREFLQEIIKSKPCFANAGKNRNKNNLSILDVPWGQYKEELNHYLD